MRTRYLNNDYFTLPPSQRHETIPFLHLPVPRLPTPQSSAVDHHLNFYSSLPDVSLHIDPFPIHSALSSFLSSVLPHRIAIPIPDPSSSVDDYPESNVSFDPLVDFVDFRSSLLAFHFNLKIEILRALVAYGCLECVAERSRFYLRRSCL